MEEGSAACSADDLENYSVGEHVGGLFIILACGGLGALLPVLAYRFPRLKPYDDVVTFGNFFGAGVVLATAFIHMIPPAIANLSNPCLGPITEDYEPLALLITMAAIFLMQLLEFVLARKLRPGAAKGSELQLEDAACAAGKAAPELATPTGAAALTAAAAAAASTVPAPVVELQHQALEGGEAAVCDDWERQHQHQVQHHHHHHHHHHHGHSHPDHNSDGDDTARSRSLVTMIVFELGVALHSVIIGVSLGVVGGREFTTLLVALVFHQFFEGFALGSAVVLTEPTARAAFAAAGAFALSAPLGTAIGIGARASFNANATATLWLLGAFEALSGGTLIYTALVELITYGLTLSPRFAAHGAPAGSVAAAFLGMYSGAAAMSVLGKWA
eukprot:TRINITY_DN3273_c0_g1_i1.p1 TRINITY_DN3273_c0_g1~~TRINITY_DN3273_c0_g1_i1.p1  ORF type:complete len:388 (-),score=146.92 TRINITY_DN3273_c0_g1_i1:757-1920(-)